MLIVIIWAMGSNFKAIVHLLAVGDGRLCQVQQTGIVVDFDVMVVIFTDIANPVVRLRIRMPTITMNYHEDEKGEEDENESGWSMISMEESNERRRRWRSGRHRSFLS